MKTFWLNFVATIAAAAVIGNAVFIWRVNERLTRIETRLGLSGAITMNQRTQTP